MEISGVIFRPTLRFSGGFSDTHSLKSSFSGGSISAKERVWCGIRSVCSENRKSLWVLNSGFCDKGYGVYVGGGKKKKKKEIVKKEKEKKELKKKTKLVKGLWKKLSMYSEMGFLDNIDVDDSISTEEGKAISKVLEILLIQLLQLKAEEKEIKRRQKEEKAKSKKAIFLENMKPPPTMDDTVESSSSSSCSSSSCCSSPEETSPMVTNTRVSSPIGEEKKVVEVLKEEDDMRCEESSSSNTTSMSSVEMGRTCSSSSSCGGERIEVCMGGKCKKNGAEGLMEELKKRVGNEGGGNSDVVVGCKCMGKCRSSPNVRVVSKMSSETRNEGSSSSNDKSKNSLYFGVGMDDLDAIVDNFMSGGDGIRND